MPCAAACNACEILLPWYVLVLLEGLKGWLGRATTACRQRQVYQHSSSVRRAGRSGRQQQGPAGRPASLTAAGVETGERWQVQDPSRGTRRKAVAAALEPHRTPAAGEQLGVPASRVTVSHPPSASDGSSTTPRRHIGVAPACVAWSRARSWSLACARAQSPAGWLAPLLAAGVQGRARVAACRSPAAAGPVEIEVRAARRCD